MGATLGSSGHSKGEGGRRGWAHHSVQVGSPTCAGCTFWQQQPGPAEYAPGTVGRSTTEEGP